jgi:hypothetical protein
VLTALIIKVMINLHVEDFIIFLRNRRCTVITVSVDWNSGKKKLSSGYVAILLPWQLLRFSWPSLELHHFSRLLKKSNSSSSNVSFLRAV